MKELFDSLLSTLDYFDKLQYDLQEELRNDYFTTKEKKKK